MKSLTFIYLIPTKINLLYGVEENPSLIFFHTDTCLSAPPAEYCPLPQSFPIAPVVCSSVCGSVSELSILLI